MTRAGVLGLVVALCHVAACAAPAMDGDDGDHPSCTGKCDGDDQFLARLRALPGVTVSEGSPAAGATYYQLTFRQPVDHDAPNGATFAQHVALLHRTTSAPMVVLTSGYWDFYGSQTFELTDVLGANQISIEHRYFGDSRPDNPDWSKLTIAQMAADEHEIIVALRGVYSGAFITTGASKGGMTAVYHRRFYPDDVEGTVPYVAPLSFGAPDDRYTPFLASVGPQACHQAVHDVALEILRSRRAAMLAKATSQAESTGVTYSRIPLDAAVESSIVMLEWTFWQYNGVDYCGSVPAVTASDSELWAFLDEISPPSNNADARVTQFDAYYFQANEQLGFPASAPDYLTPYRHYTDADYPGRFPTARPAYDGGTAMRDIDTWVQHDSSQLLFIYGQWDPWTGGRFALGGAEDSASFTEPQGTHSASLAGLSASDRQAAYAKLAAWTGVTPSDTHRAREMRPEMMREYRVPPAMLLGR